jgi:hypothetical protein
MNSSRPTLKLLCTAALLLASACGGDGEADGGAAAFDTMTSTRTAPPPPNPGGLPQGGLEQWVTDARDSVVHVIPMASTDLKRAQQHAAAAYIDRQEVIEMYYGPGGKMNPSTALANAVRAAEDRFHRVLAVLALPDSLEVRKQIAGAVDSLSMQYSEVLKVAKSSGVNMFPTGDSLTAKATADSAAAR